ncbi:MAG: transpeptidase family protein [Dysgonamonadaceae bacterium]|jgi:cell division protein FtsI (penicillin-binding protein 3)|nr:transpeptidase family protein [Dysgonamonadaceae bacterium]
MEPENIIHKKIQRNYLFVALFFACIAIAIPVRAFYTAIIEGQRWKEFAESRIQKNISVSAPRGNIYSCNGELMATSENSYRLFMDFWAEGIDSAVFKKYLHPLAVELNRLLPSKPVSHYESNILAGWNQKENALKQIKAGKKAVKNREYRLDIEEVNYLQLKEIRSMPFFRLGRNKTGLYTSSQVLRTNPYGTLALRTIGSIYGEFDKGGKNGLELGYDSLLRGKNGLATSQKIESTMIQKIEKAPVSGYDIVSTIDVNIQDITERALIEKLQEYGAESGTAVVMEVSTGEIKAITNMGKHKDGWRETKNYAVSDLSPPGSTFKVVSMMLMLEDGLIKPYDTVDTGGGSYNLPRSKFTITDAVRVGDGIYTASQSIQYSSNIGVGKLTVKAYGNQPEKYVEGIKKTGFTDMHLEIPGYAVPVIPDPKDPDRYWSGTDLFNMSYGYSTGIPPIYTLTFYNAIANGGKMVKPRFVQSIMDGGQVIERKKTEVINKHICSEQNIACIRAMLDSVVNGSRGTGAKARSETVRIAGKTGTAKLQDGNGGHQVTFCGYFPANAPQYSCIVVLRRPQGSPGGGYMAGPVVKRIAEEISGLGTNVRDVFAAVDTAAPKLPAVKSGLFKPIRYAMKKLDVDFNNDSSGQWVSTRSTEDKIVVNDRKIDGNLVPNVIGMGASDAVFALESAGLRVSLAGRGAVTSQSLTAGTQVQKGNTIAIHLQ